ncbi:efflux RND transporter periplasmic adaptor subunit [Hymenobacter jejuensis]|uniref:Efflux RND transporter periplasmic adaptor subunit n=1 Tax=Hymenobacter jejuensis TaxID=2502781 RepID=A0A5B8A2Z6_9BACT|nr:efflux RND transporter periplasmic adaptor subunit [Hymenobacter jejuensis]QDA61549.1 efflux RND transporter periplasmic adaptor subunit [Hymenobacter jejuensis]
MTDDSTAPRSNRRFWITILVIAVVFGGLFLLGLLPRLRREKALNAESKTAATAAPVLTVQPARPAPDSTRIELPADTKSNRETFVFARTDGFVKAWYADIGTRVRRGQLLALIATPELDQQISESRANLGLARTSYNRLRSVELPGAISKQELDEGQAQFAAHQAAVNRLTALQEFRRVVAPFSGIVTQRNVEVGSLVSTTNAEGAQLFKIEQTDTLRAFVNVPQNYVPSIRPGLTTDVLVPEFPDRKFAGRVSRSAGALNTSTRTLLTEVKVANRDQKLLPGMFAQVRFNLVRTTPSVIISANALVPGGTTPQVVVVQNNKVHYQPITPGRDFGAQLEVIHGLKGGELLVINPAETLQEGQEVKTRLAEVKKPESPAPPAAAPRFNDPDRPRVSSPLDGRANP